ncbi:hypothetical protein D3C80_1466630 [compost metagenome]
MGGQLVMLGLGPQAVAHPRFQAPGTAGALGGTGAGDALGIEPRHAAAGVEARHSRQACVHHHAHAVDGQAGFRDVGGQHHLAHTAGRGVDGRALRVQVEFAMQRAQQDTRAVSQCFLKVLMHPANLRLARQKHQYAAWLLRQGLQDTLDDPWLDEFTRLVGPPPADIHRVHTPFTADHRRVVE